MQTMTVQYHSKGQALLNLTTLLMAAVCLQTLTPLQGARLLVKSFPWYPDIPAVCIWISALAGNKAALSELRRLLPDETIEP